jgi:hypothetical protein
MLRELTIVTRLYTVMDILIILPLRRYTLPLYYREASPKRIALKPRIDLLGSIKQLSIPWSKQPGRWYTANSFNERLASCSGQARRRSPRGRLDTNISI